MIVQRQKRQPSLFALGIGYLDMIEKVLVGSMSYFRASGWVKVGGSQAWRALGDIRTHGLPTSCLNLILRHIPSGVVPILC